MHYFDVANAGFAARCDGFTCGSGLVFRKASGSGSK
jgi:hypothetical protein